MRLYVNGALVIDDYVDQTTHWTDGVAVNLTAGQLVDLQLEYYENTGSAVAKLKWTGPSFAGANGAIIGTQWLFDGTGVTNRMAYAHAQTVTLVQNTPQAITLTGSGGTLSYAVVTPPAHGTLTGIAPNLIYTPAVNYSGTDSFTFLVNNGTGNSTQATVSISVWAGQPVTYTWSYPVAGNWSGAANWTSGTAPAAIGQSYYNLDFAPSGTYTVTQDLNNGFQLNQLNAGGAVTFAGTNSLTFTATVSINGAAAAGTVTFQEGATVLATATLSAGVATFTATTFAVGNHVLTATFGGNATCTGSVSLPCAYAVTAKALTLTGVTAANKVYDGTTTAVLTGGALAGVINGETVTVVAGTGAFARPNVGSWPVTASGYSLGGANAGNYVLAAQPAVPSATITLGGTRPPTTTRTYNLGPQGGGTTINVATGPGSMGNLIPWIPQETLPPCSVLRSVTANIRLDSSTGASGCNDFFLYFDANPAAAGTAALMQIGGDYSGNVGTVARKLSWGMGWGGPGDTVTATKTAGVDWSGDVDLNAYQLSLGNNYATSTWSGTVTVEYDVSVLLAAPTNLLAAPGNNHIDLTWTVPTGAISYQVKRALASGGPYTVIANPSTASYTDPTAVNGTTYYYVVTATRAPAPTSTICARGVSNSPACSRRPVHSTTTATGTPPITSR